MPVPTAVGLEERAAIVASLLVMVMLTALGGVWLRYA
jgi:hypothetical protein